MPELSSYCYVFCFAFLLVDLLILAEQQYRDRIPVAFLFSYSILGYCQKYDHLVTIISCPSSNVLCYDISTEVFFDSSPYSFSVQFTLYTVFHIYISRLQLLLFIPILPFLPLKKLLHILQPSRPTELFSYSADNLNIVINSQILLMFVCFAVN